MAVPFAIPIVAPAALSFLDGLLLTVLGGYAIHETTKYVNDNFDLGLPALPLPDIPVSKPIDKQKSNLSALSSLASSVASAQDKSKESVSTAVTTLKEVVTTSHENNKSISQSMFNTSIESPLLANQVMLKDSIDSIVNAINSQTLGGIATLGTLDSHLSVISGTLTAISASILKISQTYEQEMLDIEDMPYTSQSELRKQLTALGLTSAEIDRLFQKEDQLVRESSERGKSVSETKKLLLDLRKAELSAETQLAIAKIQAGISEPAPSSNSVSLSVPNLELWASSAYAMNEAVTVDMHKRNVHAQVVKNEYVTTETDIKDLDGNTLARVKPIEAQSIKNISDARYRTDINTFEMNDTDIDDMFDGDLPDFSSLFAYDPLSVRLQNVTSSL